MVLANQKNDFYCNYLHYKGYSFIGSYPFHRGYRNSLVSGEKDFNIWASLNLNQAQFLENILMANSGGINVVCNEGVTVVEWINL